MFFFPFKGAGTEEKTLIEILASRNSRQMKEVTQAYYTGNNIFDLMDISKAFSTVLKGCFYF